MRFFWNLFLVAVFFVTFISVSFISVISFVSIIISILFIFFIVLIISVFVMVGAKKSTEFFKAHRRNRVDVVVVFLVGVGVVLTTCHEVLTIVLNEMKEIF